MQIRKMRMEDVERVSQLESETFSQPWSNEAFIDVIDRKDAVYMVAIEENKVIGTCGTIVTVGEGEIYNVVTDPQYRGQGIATKLVKSVMDCAEKELGANAFTLEVRVSNTNAIGLYEKLGFVSEGIRPKMYEKPVEDALIMWRRTEC